MGAGRVKLAYTCNIYKAEACVPVCLCMRVSINSTVSIAK